jgi:hypothetical protein
VQPLSPMTNKACSGCVRTPAAATLSVCAHRFAASSSPGSAATTGSSPISSSCRIRFASLGFAGTPRRISNRRGAPTACCLVSLCVAS